MVPQVEAALIAGVVSLISLGGTVVVAVIGFRTTRTVTGSTLAEQHIRTLNERFATAAEKLGGDKPPAVRLAGVYAMARLADDWEDNRQTCIDVLCAYLRLGYPREPEPGDEAHLTFRHDREVRHTVIRVIGDHLRDDAKISWQGGDFDFTGAVFDGGSFDGAELSRGKVHFDGATFSSGEVSFSGARFSGGAVSFSGATFSGGAVSFNGATFSSGEVSFSGATFSSGEVRFSYATFCGGEVRFRDATFSGGTVRFGGATFSGGTVRFNGATFSGGEVRFNDAGLSGGAVSFFGTTFAGGTVRFNGAAFSGTRVNFGQAQFSGGKVDFTDAADWSHPPEFAWTGPPPAEVKLPITATETST